MAFVVAGPLVPLELDDEENDELDDEVDDEDDDVEEKDDVLDVVASLDELVIDELDVYTKLVDESPCISILGFWGSCGFVLPRRLKRHADVPRSNMKVIIQKII